MYKHDVSKRGTGIYSFKGAQICPRSYDCKDAKVLPSIGFLVLNRGVLSVFAFNCYYSSSLIEQDTITVNLNRANGKGIPRRPAAKKLLMRITTKRVIAPTTG